MIEKPKEIEIKIKNKNSIKHEDKSSILCKEKYSSSCLEKEIKEKKIIKTLTSLEELTKDLEVLWETKYTKELLKKNYTKYEIQKIIKISSQVYKDAVKRLGKKYKSITTIKKSNGKNWKVNNDCVGAIMKIFENSGLRLLRGKQSKKEKGIFEYWWGQYKTYIRIPRYNSYGKPTNKTKLTKHDIGWVESMAESDKEVIRTRITPENCDKIIKKYILPGGMAPAGLYNHCCLLYVRIDGTVMLYHSGKDSRPKRIKISKTTKKPSGYIKKGKYYIRLNYSKVNEIPLKEYLKKNQKTYKANTWRSVIKFLPLRNIIKSNIKKYDITPEQIISAETVSQTV